MGWASKKSLATSRRRKQCTAVMTKPWAELKTAKSAWKRTERRSVMARTADIQVSARRGSTTQELQRDALRGTAADSVSERHSTRQDGRSLGLHSAWGLAGPRTPGPQECFQAERGQGTGGETEDKDNYRARAGAMSGRRDGRMDTAGPSRHRDCEAGMRKAETGGKQGQTEANASVRPNLHLGSFGKRHRSEPRPQRFQDSRLGREGAKNKDCHHKKRGMRQTHPQTERLNRQSLWRTPQHKSLQRRWGQASQAEAWRSLRLPVIAQNPGQKHRSWGQTQAYVSLASLP